LWCQASPSDGSASQKTLVEWSSMANRRRPKKWQIELIDHVMWCTRKIRTSPPHTSAASAASQEPPLSASPSRNGSPSEASTIQGNERLIRRITGSSTRSAAKRREGAWPWVENSQPMCACQRPAAIPFSPAPCPTCGL
jgi:hypothetical protein